MCPVIGVKSPPVLLAHQPGNKNCPAPKPLPSRESCTTRIDQVLEMVMVPQSKYIFYCKLLLPMSGESRAGGRQDLGLLKHSENVNRKKLQGIA